jgi:threonine/homoserine/homoserine lactone efflux protein
MLWLAYKIATAEPSLTPNGETRSKPMTFWNAVAFQWINPKAWTMCLTGVTAYTVQSNYLESLIIMTLVYMLVNLPSVSAWAVFGVALRGFLADAKRVRIFNIIMAIILVVSLWPVAASLIHDGQVAHI